MKILMLTPYLPYPLLSGGQIRSYNLLKFLSKKHEITLFSFIRSEAEKIYIPQLKEFCNDVKIFLKRPPWTITSLLLSSITVYPLVVCMYLQNGLKEEIENEIKKKDIDLIHAETFYVMPNIPQNNIPTILVEQTIEYLVYQHYTESIKLLPLKLMMNFDVLKIKYWEKMYWHKATRVVAMSSADKKVMQKLAPNLTVDLVPNGVDINFFVKKEHRNINKKIILFVGNFKWLQNSEAVSILVNDIWPIIMKKLPDAKLWIVGKYPSKEILKYTGASIMVSQDIEDIRVAYSKSDVLLAPIYGPGGTRFKILEAMAAGLPVVTTHTGIEGLGAKDNIDALIKDNPEELAEETVRVLTDQTLYKKLVINGKNLVSKKFNWEKIADNLDRIYKKALND